MNYVEILRSKKHNKHYLNRYIKLIKILSTRHSFGHKHHICPKAKDMFPEYKNSVDWNTVSVTEREHFILHWILAKAYPGTSQTLAFYHMSNRHNKHKSRDYETARRAHIEAVIAMTQNPERNAKISKALKGRPKSEAHKAKLIGHVVTDETKQKLREAMTGRKHTEESKAKMSSSRIGKPRGAHSEVGKRNISVAKMTSILVTPKGEFRTYEEVAAAYSISLNKATNIFRCLDKKPKPTTLTVLGIEYTVPKTYRQLGFDRKPI